MSVINTFPIYKKQKEPDAIGLRSALFTGLIWEKGISPERFFSFLWESRTLKPANHPSSPESGSNLPNQPKRQLCIGK